MSQSNISASEATKHGQMSNSRVLLLELFSFCVFFFSRNNNIVNLDIKAFESCWR